MIMENLPIEYISVCVVALPYIVQALKSRFTSIDPRFFSGAISALFGLLYAVLKTFSPLEFFAVLSSVASLTYAIGTAVYKVQKPSKKNEANIPQ